MDKSLQLIIILTGTITLVCGKLKIVDLKVPSTIESGSNNEVILDCDYEVKNETGLTVKWFFDNEEQIYQWIPSHSKPQALGLLKDRVDLEYRASNDSNTMFRALRIKDITPDLSGYYTCKVASFYTEDSVTKRMIIYEPAKEFEMTLTESARTINCTASGVYPEPKMNLYILEVNQNRTLGEDNDANHNGVDDDKEDNESGEDVDVIELTEDNLYNVTSILDFEGYDLPQETVFICELWIPGTTYRKTLTRKFYPGGFPTTDETQIEFDYGFTTNATQQEVSGSCPKDANIAASLLLALLFQRIF